MTWEIREGDCVEQMRSMDEGSVDAIVTDPPYGLEFMGKEWDQLQARGRGAKVREKRAAERTPDGRGHSTSKGPYLAAGVDWQGANQSQMQEWHQAWATEALRVLKPGGHLLAFGGTRTYHRLACAIEDAGFEIRDSVIWMYGSGFPKSLDVSKAIDKTRREDEEPKRRVAKWLRERMPDRHLVAEYFGVDESMVRFWIGTHGRVIQTPTFLQWSELKDLLGLRDLSHLPECEPEQAVPEGTKSSDAWPFASWCAPGCPVAELNEMDAEIWRLNGRKGTPGENWEQRETIGEQTKARSIESASALPTLGAEVKYQTWDVTAPATPEAAQWEGWGTALKPGHEPIVVARKPLSGTVAQNVLEHGTGALNIDGCRIGTDENLNGGAYTEGREPRAMAPGGASRNAQPGEYEQPPGRWPANVVLSHLPECEGGPQKVRPGEGLRRVPGARPPSQCAPGCPIAELDEQSGERVSGAGNKNTANRDNGQTIGHGLGAGSGEGIGGDTGGASRFFATFSDHGLSEGAPTVRPGSGLGEPPAPLAESDPEKPCRLHGIRRCTICHPFRFRYCAKASRGERNAGLEGFEKQGGQAGELTARGNTNPVCDKCGGSRIDRGRGRCECEIPAWRAENKQQRNVHPTVKPIDLMRWLVRLVTPPGGTVLDPFTGSGTTGIAAVLEGFDFVGIEREPEYVEIAKARIDWWEHHQGREAEEVLAESRRSEALREQHEAAGQLGLEF